MRRIVAFCIALFMSGHGAFGFDNLAAGLDGVMLEDLQATRVQPLFSPTRRAPDPPAPVIKAPVATEPPAPAVKMEASTADIMLVGILLSGETQMALLRDNVTGIVTRVPSGGHYGEWTLSVLGPRQVRLEGGSDNFVQSLFAGTSAAFATARSQEPESKPVGLWR